MKKILKFSMLKRRPDMPLRHEYLLPAIFDRIVKRFPEIANDRRTSVEVAMEENDPKLVEIFQFLEHELGLRGVRTNSLYPKVDQKDDTWFTIDTNYEFDEEDIECAMFLSMFPDDDIGRDGRLGEGWDQWGLLRAAAKIPLIGSLGSVPAVCTAAVREELMKEDFGGLEFLPVIVHDPRYREGDFWRIWANRTMPKVAMPLCDLEGGPVKDDYSTGCVRDERISNQRVLKYRVADLAAMSGTDFALTAEKWCSPNARFQREWLVVSQRVRQWCLKKKVKAEWTPVIALPE